MKKVLSLFLSFVMGITVLTASFSAFAATKEVFIGNNHCENKLLNQYTSYDSYGNPITHYEYSSESFVFTSLEDAVYSFSYDQGIEFIGKYYSYCICDYDLDTVNYYYRLEKGTKAIFKSGAIYKHSPYDDSLDDREDAQAMIRDDYYERGMYYEYYMEYEYKPTQIHGIKCFDLTIKKLGGKITNDIYEIDIDNKRTNVVDDGFNSSKYTICKEALYPVSTIKEYAFYNKPITEITIPSSVKYVEDYAFSNCVKLKKVVFENPDTVYGKNAFFNCREDLEIVGGVKGKYSDTLKPKESSVKKLKKGKKSFKATWKKVSGVTGYEVQYSLKKNMKSAKKKVVKGAGKTSVTIKKLKSKRTYYVRVRTYKTINGKKYYSKWSKVKPVKTK